MDFIIRKSIISDLPAVMDLIASGRRIMRSCGDDRQWPEGTPSEETLRRDIEAGNGYLVLSGETPVATFAFLPGPDPTYAYIEGGSWRSDAPYRVIHRLAKVPEAKGVLPAVLRWCFERTDSIRIDTHEDNAIMRHCLEQAGFLYCGIIYLENGDPRLAFQKDL